MLICKKVGQLYHFLIGLFLLYRYNSLFVHILLFFVSDNAIIFPNIINATVSPMHGYSKYKHSCSK